MITLYGIKNCDSVKKALKFFTIHDISYEFHDFKTNPIVCDKLSAWVASTSLKTIFNARSTTYRNLKLKEKNLNEKEKLKWLCQENLLIKRPVIEYKNKVIVGFNEETYQGVFL